MQNTRLSTFVDRLLGQFGRWLRNPWRRLSLLLISILLGNFLATIVSTISGQQADLDVVVSIFLVIASEVISWAVYKSDRLRIQAGRDVEPRPFLLEILNGTKLGFIYGLFVEAFKLGS
ncbi:MAG: DUF565 domain-containing protein [Cyanobacteria bacterium CRU_2_1]|nr:DUF565 domain-containing protein [Cyanobacteria bacterium RU_5_0]NJR60094.1 DUF565 domain-containing protein [Cyanobacteria bacterium CRU_2_1]